MITVVSDQRLRELERKWRESGSLMDEAAYLRERVRVGDLTQERLELAAAFGHAPSRIATGCDWPVMRWHTLEALAEGSHCARAWILTALAELAVRELSKRPWARQWYRSSGAAKQPAVEVIKGLLEFPPVSGLPNGLSQLALVIGEDARASTFHPSVLRDARRVFGWNRLRSALEALVPVLLASPDDP